MTSLKHSIVKSGLLRKGFRISESDHSYFVFYHNDLPTQIWTKLSHSSRDLGEPLIHSMVHQTRLNKKQFVDLVKCLMSRDDYIAMLEKQKISLS